MIWYLNSAIAAFNHRKIGPLGFNYETWNAIENPTIHYYQSNNIPKGVSSSTTVGSVSHLISKRLKQLEERNGGYGVDLSKKWSNKSLPDLTASEADLDLKADLVRELKLVASREVDLETSLKSLKKAATNVEDNNNVNTKSFSNRFVAQVRPTAWATASASLEALRPSRSKMKENEAEDKRMRKVLRRKKSGLVDDHYETSTLMTYHYPLVVEEMEIDERRRQKSRQHLQHMTNPAATPNVQAQAHHQHQRHHYGQKKSPPSVNNNEPAKPLASPLSSGTPLVRPAPGPG